MPAGRLATRGFPRWVLAGRLGIQEREFGTLVVSLVHNKKPMAQKVTWSPMRPRSPPGYPQGPLAIPRDLGGGSQASAGILFPACPPKAIPGISGDPQVPTPMDLQGYTGIFGDPEAFPGGAGCPQGSPGTIRDPHVPKGPCGIPRGSPRPPRWGIPEAAPPRGQPEH